MGSQRLRLLYVSHSFPPAEQPLANIGGMQRVATELYDAFRRHPDVEVSELVLRTSWRWTHLRTVPFLIKLLLAIPRRMRQRQIDTVLFSSMVTASVAVGLDKLGRTNDVKLAAIAHGRDVTLPLGLYQRFVPAVFEALDLVLPVSRATAHACAARGLPTSKCQVVPNGVDPHRFLDSRSTGIHEHLYPQRPLKLCSVGRLVERKGFGWFIREVMPVLPDNVHYYLAGDGPRRNAIEETARRADVEHRVHVLGQISEDELAHLYHSADLYIMPNIPISGDMEGFGIVMLEAGICGVPTIAANLEGVRDVITDGKNGHLVEPQNAAAFAEQIRSYADSPERLSEASNRAKAFVREHFAWSSVVDRYVSALERSHTERRSVQV